MKKIELEFAGIDRWNRPVLKEKSGRIYYCFTDTLFGYSEVDVEKAKDWLRRGAYYDQELIIKGSKFDGEPSHPVNKDKFKITA